LQSAGFVHSDNSFPFNTADFSLWSKLEHLEFTGSFLPIDVSLPRTLKHLDISKTCIFSPFSTDESVTVIDLPLLETFMCNKVNFSLEVVFALIGPSIKAGNLKTLHIGDYGPDMSFSWEQAIPTKDLLLPSLQNLSLKKCQMREDAVVKFLRLCPNLQYVDLSFTRVTGVAIKELMTREVGPLKWLSVNGCGCLSSDAVEWARSLGTIVEYNNDPLKRPVGQRLWRDRPT
jgi:F-box/TPR repeat protein Pof3